MLNDKIPFRVTEKRLVGYVIFRLTVLMLVQQITYRITVINSRNYMYTTDTIMAILSWANVTDHLYYSGPVKEIQKYTPPKDRLALLTRHYVMVGEWCWGGHFVM